MLRIFRLLPVALALAFALVASPVRALDISLDGFLRGQCGTATASANAATLNNKCGVITSESLTTAAGSSYTLTLTNSTIAATDIVLVSVASGATINTYQVGVDAIAAGSCRIHVRNVSALSQSEAIVLTFTVIKGATS